MAHDKTIYAREHIRTRKHNNVVGTEKQYLGLGLFFHFRGKCFGITTCVPKVNNRDGILLNGLDQLIHVSEDNTPVLLRQPLQ